MLEFLKEEANNALTENGAATYATTNSDCLDLFAAIGALRTASEHEIIVRFSRAYAENADMTMKLLFFARDVRGGLGERRVFRTILRWLAGNEPAALRKNIAYVAEFGRFDDLLALIGTPCEADALALIEKQLKTDLAALENGTEVSLLAKWLPSVNATCAETVRLAKAVARSLGMDDAAYRKTLSKLRARIKIIENNLRQRDYSFDYAKQPSKAMFKYRKAFLHNDNERYRAYLDSVARGESVLHTGSLTPYDIIAPFFSTKVTEDERKAIDTEWNAQENFANGENALAVIDGSGSMYGGMTKPLPAAVAMSLGIYFAERNTGCFRGHFITFSRKPQLVEIKGADILERVRCCSEYNEAANTDLESVFKLILNAAVNNCAEQKDMPTRLYIVSDMEFDCCMVNAGISNFENAKRLFAEHGYVLPEVVFWNVSSRNRQQPVSMNEQGVALVSGCTPRIFSMLKGDVLSPYHYMMEVLNAERYAVIAA